MIGVRGKRRNDNRMVFSAQYTPVMPAVSLEIGREVVCGPENKELDIIRYFLTLPRVHFYISWRMRALRGPVQENFALVSNCPESCAPKITVQSRQSLSRT